VKAQAPSEAQVKAALDSMMKAFGAAASGAAPNQPAAPTPEAAPAPQPSTALAGDDAQGGSREQEVKKIIDDAFKEGQKNPPVAPPKQNP
jgi:hypothetical protein